MKIAMTISDASDMAGCGGELERQTHIVDVPNELIPPAIKRHLAEKQRRETAMEKGTPLGWYYVSMSISLVAEEQ